MATTIIQSPPFIPPPNNPTAHNIYDVDDDDTLSLRDLPITATSTVDHHPSTSPSRHQQNNNSRRSSSDPTSDFFFEFLINNDDDLITSSADDVIFGGRLLPFAPPQQQPQSLPRRSLSLSSRITRRQFTESSSSLYSDSPPPTIRPSKSLNYRKLHRNQRSYSKPKSDFLHRYSCNNSSNNNSSINSEKLLPAKSPWSWLIFGLPTIPAEMELKDIKNRQFRRNLTTSKSLNYSGDNCKSCSSASWKFLNVLSCKSHATVDVSNTTPFRNSLI